MSIATKDHAGETLMRKTRFKALLALLVVASALLLLTSRGVRILYYLHVAQSEPLSIDGFMAFSSLLELGDDEVPPAGALDSFEKADYRILKCRRLTGSKIVMEVYWGEEYSHLVYLLLERNKEDGWRILARCGKFRMCLAS